MSTTELRLPTLNPQGVEDIAFGPFRLNARERLLFKGEHPVRVGSRALDILIALVERPGEIVSHDELAARTWPDTQVGSGALRVHVSALRKILADSSGGIDFISNVAGRGYCFSAAVSQPVSQEYERSTPYRSLPPAISWLTGREEEVEAIRLQLVAERLVSIVGSGGIGKTTVAIAVAHAAAESFNGQVCYLDLGVLRDPLLVAPTLGDALKFPLEGDSLGGLLEFLSHKRVLIVLDNCEHMIDPITIYAEKIYAGTTHVHILTTSREPLGIEGERLHRLKPLAYPVDQCLIGVSDALRYPAVRLLVDRISMTLNDFELRDEDVAAAVDICRKVDGIALAIELAAARVSVYGLREVASLLDGRISLIWRGRRNAPPRQQTLTATLDWSYRLLSSCERHTLNQLSVLIGSFTLEAAHSIVGIEDYDGEPVTNAIGGLVSKSLLVADRSSPVTRYRLLHITREYGYERLIETGEVDNALQRHAAYFLDLIEVVDGGVAALISLKGNPEHIREISNVRVALEWSFSVGGDVATGVRLATASAALFLSVSIADECERWTRLAIDSLDANLRGSRPEMLLQAALGMSLRYSYGDAYRDAFLRSIAIAEQLGDVEQQLQLLHYMNVAEMAQGYPHRALKSVLKGNEVVRARGIPSELAISSATLGVIYHVIGQVEEARHYTIEALDLLNTLPPDQINGIDPHIFSQSRHVIAKNLWYRGYPVQAMDECRTILAASRAESEYYWQNAVIWLNHVFQWSGDWKTVKALVGEFVATARRGSRSIVETFVTCLKADLLVFSENTDEGVDLLEKSLPLTRASNIRVQMLVALATGYKIQRRYSHALAVADQLMQEEQEFGTSYWTPEARRVRGEIMAASDHQEAEAAFISSLQLARTQCSLAWELRCATSLARLMVRQKRRQEAADLLSPIYGRFTEGFETSDLRSARAVMMRTGLQSKNLSRNEIC